MKVAIYARVSTDEQTVESQLEPLKAMIAARGDDLVEVYAENETAWKAGHQRELKRLLNDARLSRFRRVYIWALDRLTREGIERLFSIIRQLQGYGVDLVSREESWTEYPSEFKDILFAVVGFVANFESRRRSERMKAWHETKRRRGERTGRLPNHLRQRRRKVRAG